MPRKSLRCVPVPEVVEAEVAVAEAEEVAAEAEADLTGCGMKRGQSNSHSAQCDVEGRSIMCFHKMIQSALRV